MRRPTPVGLFETVEPTPPLSHVIKERHAPWAKFESKDEWLVTSDWGLVTGNLHTTLGHRPIYICGEAATFILHSSFLIRAKLSSTNKGDSTSPRLILNPEPPKQKT